MTIRHLNEIARAMRTCGFTRDTLSRAAERWNAAAETATDGADATLRAWAWYAARESIR